MTATLLIALSALIATAVPGALSFVLLRRISDDRKVWFDGVAYAVGISATAIGLLVASITIGAHVLGVRP